MMYRVVMDIVQGGPEVSRRFQWPLETVIPNFASASCVLTIPIMRRTAMKLTELPAQLSDRSSSCEHMVVIWQYAPSMRAERMLRASSQDFVFRLGHSPRI